MKSWPSCMSSLCATLGLRGGRSGSLRQRLSVTGRAAVSQRRTEKPTSREKNCIFKSSFWNSQHLRQRRMCFVVSRCCRLTLWGTDQSISLHTWCRRFEMWALCLSKDTCSVRTEPLCVWNAIQTFRKLITSSRGGNCAYQAKCPGQLLRAGWRRWQDLAVSAITGMNGPVVGRHSAAVQQGLFNQLNDRRADGQRASHRHTGCCNDANSAGPGRPRDEARKPVNMYEHTG